MDIIKAINDQLQIKEIGKDEMYGFFSLSTENQFADVALPCFRLAKQLKSSPQVIAEQLKSTFKETPLVKSVEAVNGYLNFFLSESYLAQQVLMEILDNPDFGKSSKGNGKIVCIDYSSINIAKSFHFGHLLTTVIGSSLIKIFKFLGYKTIGINHLGDWGTQFGKLIVAYKKWSSKEEVERDGVSALERIYIKFHVEEEKDPGLGDEARKWFAKIEKSDKEALAIFEWFKKITLIEAEKTYKRLNVSFDSYDGESFYNDKMDEILEIAKEKKIVEKSDGALIVNLDNYNMPPCLLVKADGATLYATRDLAAALYRKRTYDFDSCLYVVAYQQNLHFKQVFKVLELMDFDWHSKLEHVAYGMVSLEDGPMSTRKGNLVKLNDVLDKSYAKALKIIEEKNPNLENKESIAEKVSTGAVIFSALQNSRIKDLVFTYDRVLNFDGETCPYLQYTVARINSVLEKGADCLTSKRIKPDFSALENTETKEVIKLLNRFPSVVFDAGEKREPSIISNYLIDLAQSFNKFYFEHRIINSDTAVQLSRILVSKSCGIVLQKGLGLLGIDCPEKM